MRRRVYLAATLVACLLMNGCYRPSPANTANHPDEPMDGWQVYTASCASCHQPDGMGVKDKFPPLAGSEWVTGPATRLIALSLDGVTGPQNVGGVEYRGIMPAWGSALTDSQLAAALTYARQTWGNAAPPVSAMDVYKVRITTAARKTFWTSSELLEMSDPKPTSGNTSSPAHGN